MRSGQGGLEWSMEGAWKVVVLSFPPLRDPNPFSHETNNPELRLDWSKNGRPDLS